MKAATALLAMTSTSYASLNPLGSIIGFVALAPFLSATPLPCGEPSQCKPSNNTAPASSKLSATVYQKDVLGSIFKKELNVTSDIAVDKIDTEIELSQDQKNALQDFIDTIPQSKHGVGYLKNSGIIPMQLTFIGDVSVDLMKADLVIKHLDSFLKRVIAQTKNQNQMSETKEKVQKDKSKDADSKSKSKEFRINP